MTSSTHFDAYAESYDATLDRALAVSGEGKDYYARERVRFLAARLKGIGASPRMMIDYACGIGSTTPHFFDLLGLSQVVGVDVSSRSLEVATRLYGSSRATFLPAATYRHAGVADLVYCNGTFHHIPVNDREGVVGYMAEVLRPGGVLAVWENNPYNPGTRYIMSRCEFDVGAILVTPAELRRLLRQNGFDVVRTDYLFVFPRFLAWFRPLEKWMSWLPFGGQYQVLARRIQAGLSGSGP